MYAIVKTGGKQYRVAVDDVIEVEKLAAETDQVVELEVVFIADGTTVTTDTDALLKAKVFATVLGQVKGDKQIIFKFKKRKGYKKLKGHRQDLTRLRVDAISLDGKAPKPAAKKAAKEETKAKEVEAEVKKTEAVADKVEEAPVEKKPKARTTKAKTVEAPAAEKVEEAPAEDTPAEAEAEKKPVRKTRKKAVEDTPETTEE